MKNIYFISDVHLDLNREKDTEDRKENLIAFLESIEKKALKIVFVGDLFDFWFEWYYVIPGYHFESFREGSAFTIVFSETKDLNLIVLFP